MDGHYGGKKVGVNRWSVDRRTALPDIYQFALKVLTYKPLFDEFHFIDLRDLRHTICSNENLFLIEEGLTRLVSMGVT